MRLATACFRSGGHSLPPDRNMRGREEDGEVRDKSLVVATQWKAALERNDGMDLSSMRCT